LNILESHDLVLHERDEGGHHYHHLAPEHCGVLVAQALAKTYATNMRIYEQSMNLEKSRPRG